MKLNDRGKQEVIQFLEQNHRKGSLIVKLPEGIKWWFDVAEENSGKIEIDFYYGNGWKNYSYTVSPEGFNE